MDFWFWLVEFAPLLAILATKFLVMTFLSRQPCSDVEYGTRSIWPPFWKFYSAEESGFESTHHAVQCCQRECRHVVFVRSVALTFWIYASMDIRGFFSTPNSSGSLKRTGSHDSEEETLKSSGGKQKFGGSCCCWTEFISLQSLCLTWTEKHGSKSV